MPHGEKRCAGAQLVCVLFRFGAAAARGPYTDFFIDRHGLIGKAHFLLLHCALFLIDETESTSSCNQTKPLARST